MPPVLTGAQIRETFLSFFDRELETDGKAHKRLPSASLVPANNPTVMLTPAGMLPFVPIFLGVEPAPTPPRATTSQKCARVSGKASDLEAVGRTPRHHTFFEMLGNFSFGDYFKAEIIPWAWRLLTATDGTGYGLDPERLIITVFEGDEQTPPDTEAEAIWRDVVGIPPERILKFGAKDNFWGPPGPTGPCGPCSEIHYDLTGNPADDFDTRYMEIWNLVFMEFFKDGEGRLTPLEKKNVDTGMGLERITCILQNKPNTFETDLLFPILQAVAKRAGVNYTGTVLPSPYGYDGTEIPSTPPFRKGRGQGEGLDQPKHLSDIPLPNPLPKGEGAMIYPWKTALPHEIKERIKELRVNQTPAEEALWDIVRRKSLYNLKFKRQHSIEPYIVDFYCHEAKLVIELDGGQHNEESNRQYDHARTQFLESKGLKVLRFWNNEVLSNLEGVVDKILDHVAMVTPSPLGGGEGEGFDPATQLSNKPFTKEEGEETDIALKIVTDHLRFLAFALADGLIYGNVKRDYIPRMICRRAVRYGKRFLGFKEPFLYSLIDEVVNLYGHAYPELIENKERIKRLTKAEEERFFETLEKGLQHLNYYVNLTLTNFHNWRVLLGNITKLKLYYNDFKEEGMEEDEYEIFLFLFEETFSKYYELKKDINVNFAATLHNNYTNALYADLDHAIADLSSIKRGLIPCNTYNNSEELNLLLDQALEALAKLSFFPGREAFRLYDTYGFPVELTKDILAEHELELDEIGFETAMAEQKSQSRADKKDKTQGLANTVLTEILQEVGATPFVGYDTLDADVTVTALIVDGERVGEVHGTNTPFLAVLDRTPFYPEGGGQVGDRGTLIEESGEQGHTVVVKDTQKIGELIVHHCVFDQGVPLRVGDKLKALVEPTTRHGSAIHHSATHLLHGALGQVLGGEAAQAGSYVSAEGARFDFSFPRAVTPDELVRVESLMNTWIRHGSEREIFDMSPEEAKAAGAIAMFGEKYGERVRVVRFGAHSIELCGGTHAGSLAEIGLAKIVGEQAVASGVRRIEFVVGEVAYRAFRQESETVRRLAQTFKVQPQEVIERVEKLQDDLKARDKAIAELQTKLALVHVDAIVEKLKVRQAEGMKPLTLSYQLKEVSADGLRALAQGVADKVKEPFALLLGSDVGGKAQLLAWVSEPLTKEGLKAGDIVKAAAQLCGGNGGGKPTMAQAGGPDVGRLAEALARFVH